MPAEASRPPHLGGRGAALAPSGSGVGGRRGAALLEMEGGNSPGQGGSAVPAPRGLQRRAGFGPAYCGALPRKVSCGQPRGAEPSRGAGAARGGGVPRGRGCAGRAASGRLSPAEELRARGGGSGGSPFVVIPCAGGALRSPGLSGWGEGAGGVSFLLLFSLPAVRVGYKSLRLSRTERYRRTRVRFSPAPLKCWFSSSFLL